jgi:outer membrane receptor protein involved in Fe transport
MKPASPLARLGPTAAVALIAAFASLPSGARAQAAPKPPAPTPAAAAAVAEGEPIELSPFSVTTDKNEGYLATSSLAGTRLNTSLRDIAAPISVITPQFLQDTGVTNVTELLVYTTGTEVAGIGGNFLGTTSGDVTGLNEILRAPHKATRVRGLNNADLTRDFFPTDIPLDSYNITGIDISRGPNSVLYGLGSPAGIINYSLKVPNLNRNAYSAELRYGSYGSHRASVDVDQVLVPGVLGVRVTGLSDEAKYRQEFKFDHTKRAYGAIRWTPRLGRNVYTQLGVNFEAGETSANRQALTPPEDFISSWFTSLNKWTKPDVDGNGWPSELGPFLVGGPNNNWWDSLAVVYSDPGSNATGGNGVPDAIRQRGGNPWGGWVGVAPRNWGMYGANPLAQKATFAGNPALLAIINDFEARSGRTFSGFGGWKDQQILNSSVFDYYERSLAGPNNNQFNEFDSTALNFVQTYFGGRVGIEAVYDNQTYEDGYTNLIGGSNRITIDINQYLRSGLRNPNVGRPMIVDASDGNIREVSRENVRATAYAKLDFKELFPKRAWLGRIAGSHVVTGVYSKQRESRFSRSFNLFGWDSSYTAIDNDDRVYGLHYLGGSLLNASSLAGANIQGINVLRTPPASLKAMVQGSTRVTPPVNNWDVITVGTYLDPTRLYNGASANRAIAKNNAFIWQSRFLDDTVVGLFGYRDDDYERWTKPSALRDTAGKTLPFAPQWTFDGTKPLVASKSTTSYGLMVHSPRFINERLPWGSRVSLGYNESSNFNPSAVSTNIWGQQNASPSGESKDYTLLVTALNDRVSFRVTKYETTQMNTRWTGSAPGIWDIKGRLARAMNGMMAETWIDGRLAMTPSGVAGRQNTTPESIVNRWMFGDTYDKTIAQTPLPAGWTVQNRPELLTQPLRVRASAATTPEGTLGTDGRPLTQPPITVEEADYRAAWFAARTDAQWYRPFGQEMFNALEFRKDPNRKWGFWDENTPANYGNIADIKSEGWEYELTVNPTRNWRVILNASEQQAVGANIMTSLGTFFDKYRPFFRDGYNPDDVGKVVNYWQRNGFADIDMWGNANTQMMHDITASAERSYLVGAASEGRPVNELRKWHVNVVSTYEFTRGRLKGTHVGGSVRWLDKSKVGYMPKYLKDLNQWIDDLDRPYYAPSQTNYDLWMTYKRKLTDKIDWAVQLNVRNLFAEDELIATQVNPDGSVAQARIPAETTWTLSTRFEY